MSDLEMQYQATILAKYKTNHVLHLLLSIITVGFWIPVWLLVALSNGMERGKANRKMKRIIKKDNITDEEREYENSKPETAIQRRRRMLANNK